MKALVERMGHHWHTGWHEFMHWLYDPAAFGRKCYRVRFPLVHKVHLIPGRLIQRSCDNYDRRLGLTEDEIRRAGPTG